MHMHTCRVPQSLLSLGVLTYTPELLQQLRKGSHLTAGGEEETEIRGCSIWAVEVSSLEPRIVILCLKTFAIEQKKCTLRWFWFSKLFAKYHSLHCKK